MKIRIAELIIAIHNQYPEMEYYSWEYIADDQAEEDFTVIVKNEDIAAEMKMAPWARPGYCEWICAYREIGFRLTDFDGMIMHAALLEVDGIGIAILARSGTGKTTLACNILAEYGDKARIINGDKPIIRFVNGRLMAFGTPWNGKEKYGCNDCVELKKLCFIQRGLYNHIEPMNTPEIFKLLFQQLLIPKDENAINNYFTIVEHMLYVTESYRMTCTEEQSAASIAIEGMKIC